jgi:hypothetical protein
MTNICLSMKAARFSCNITFRPKSFTNMFRDRPKFVNLCIDIYGATNRVQDPLLLLSVLIFSILLF